VYKDNMPSKGVNLSPLIKITNLNLKRKCRKN